MKFGLMKFDYTTNLGNEIQSIAARRFLPKIDYFIDHEKLNMFKNDEKVRMIMNGWYLDCLESWPPSPDIDPLLISMHFNTSVNDTKKIISTKESRDFFSSYGPVGCRDISTLNLLNELDIEAYYSGDLTLTLNGKCEKNDYKYVVVNSFISKEIIEFLKTKMNINMDIYEIQQESTWSFDQKYLDKMPYYYSLNSFYNYEEKFFMAENILKIYENAHCVITDRVHCALPCLALKTPVLFFNSANYARERLEGLNKLFFTSTFQEYCENYDIFDIENPPKNPKNYLKIRYKLLNKTKKFTGHLNDCYDTILNKELNSYKQTALLSKTTYETRNYMQNIFKLSNKYEQKLSEINKEKNMIITKQKQEIIKLKEIISQLQEKT